MTDHWADYYGQRGLCGEYDPFFHQRPNYRNPMTKMNHKKTKLGRQTLLTDLRESLKTWEPRSSSEIRKDLSVISAAWEGTRSDRQAWAMLKEELQVSQLEEKRIAAAAARRGM